MIQWTVSAQEAGRNLYRSVKKHCPEVPESLLQKTFRKKDVKVNHVRCNKDTVLCEGDVVEVYLRYDRTDAAVDAHKAREGLLMHVPIIYEDEHLVVFDKPAGLLCQKANAGDVSLSEYAKTYSPEAGLLNRLDRNTSGIVLCGKDVKTLQTYSNLIKNHDCKKEYLAYLSSTPSPKQGWLLHDYDKDEAKNEAGVRLVYRGESRPEADFGTQVLCHYQMLTDHLVLLELVSGKSHQLRAQMADIGCPIVGDTKYGAKRADRLMLHAYQYTINGHTFVSEWSQDERH